MKKVVKSLLPWIITGIALYLAFSGFDWQETKSHIKSVNYFYLFLAVIVTFLSYLIRSYRWINLFPDKDISYWNSVKIVFLGFFMNNILPARAGELVRAHAGAKVTNKKRTFVLATIAAERLADGLIISLLFLTLCAGSVTHISAHALMWVAGFFFVASFSVFLIVIIRKFIFSFLKKLSLFSKNKFFQYSLDRIQVFIEGLSPIGTKNRLPILLILSLVVWLTELLVYYLVLQAYSAPSSLARTVLFMVAVNFSSLIPSAPGAIGVIEVIAKTVLQGDGIVGSLALTMVITQHLIQYIVVGVPGILILILGAPASRRSAALPAAK